MREMEKVEEMEEMGGGLARSLSKGRRRSCWVERRDTQHV